MKAARSKNLYAKIKGNSLQINDEVYTIQQLQKIDIGSDGNEIHNFEIQVTKSNSAPSTPVRQQVNLENVFNFEIEESTPVNRKNKNDKKEIELSHRRSSEVTKEKEETERKRTYSEKTEQKRRTNSEKAIKIKE